MPDVSGAGTAELSSPHSQTGVRLLPYNYYFAMLVYEAAVA